MRFWLLIKSGCSVPDFEAECEAASKLEAVAKFKEENQMSLREFSPEDLLEHICEEPEAIQTELI